MDISLQFDGQDRFADIFIDAPGLLTGQDLESALIISLFTDRRANDDDPLSLNESRRGWWADTYNTNRNDKIGSRLWLLQRAKMIQATLVRAREYVLEATRWLIEDNVATQIEVETEFLNRSTMAIGIRVVKPSGTDEFQFEYVWNELNG